MHLLAALGYAIFLWYVSTGVILLLNHLPSRTFRGSLTAASLVAAASLIGIAATAQAPTTAAATFGFTCGVLVWGWHEMAFFMGVITGPRRTAGPPTTGWRHFRDAAQTCVYHELAIALTASLILALSWHAANQTAAATFLSLWIMRLSAKLNIFLGVRNLNEAWIPRRLTYLLPYMKHANFNWLLPFSLLGGTAATLHYALLTAAPTAFQSTAAALLAGILGLAVVEHAFMVIPLPFARLWHRFLAKCPADPSLRTALTTSHARPARPKPWIAPQPQP